MAQPNPFTALFGINPEDPFGLSGGSAGPRGVSEETLSPLVGNAGELDRYADAIGRIESGNRYDRIGPTHPRYGRALGRYQIMESNLPQWLRDAGLPAMTADDFLASPAAQDAVFRNRFGQYAQRYGAEGAARAWFAGPGGMNELARRDSLGTSVAEYGSRFTAALGQPAGIITGSTRRKPAMADPFSRLFPSEGGAAVTGQPDMLDILGIGQRARERFALEAGADRRARMTLDAHQQQQEQALASADADRAALTALQQEFARRAQAVGGNLRVALNGLFATPQFADAFARSPTAVMTFVQQLPQIAGALVDPGEAVRAELGAPPASPQVAPGPDAADPSLTQPRPGGALSHLPPTAQRALDAASRISPQTTAQAVAQGLASQVFPPPGQAFTLREGAARYDAQGRLIAERAPRPIETAEARSRATRSAQILDRIGQESETGGRVLADLTALEGAFDRIEAGGSRAWTTGLQSLAAQYGIDLGGNASDLQLVQAIAGRLGPQQRTPGTGPLSDFETRSLLSTLPNAWQTPEGRRLVMRQLRTLAEHQQRRGEIANEFFAGERGLNATFQALVREDRDFGRHLKELRERTGNDGCVDVSPGVRICPEGR